MITVQLSYKPIKIKLKVHIFIEFTVATVTFCNKEKNHKLLFNGLGHLFETIKIILILTCSIGCKRRIVKKIC